MVEASAACERALRRPPESAVSPPLFLGVCRVRRVFSRKYVNSGVKVGMQVKEICARSEISLREARGETDPDVHLDRAPQHQAGGVAVLGDLQDLYQPHHRAHRREEAQHEDADQGYLPAHVDLHAREQRDGKGEDDAIEEDRDGREHVECLVVGETISWREGLPVLLDLGEHELASWPPLLMALTGMHWKTRTNVPARWLKTHVIMMVQMSGR